MCRFSQGSKKPFLLLVSSSLLLLSQMKIRCEASNEVERSLLRYYKPLAMDESVNAVPSDIDPGFRVDVMPDYLQSYSVNNDLEPYANGMDSSGFRGEELTDIEDWRGRNISDTLFLEPKTPTKTLTKLITGSQSPSFMHPKLIFPEKSSGKDSKVLATYKFYVPIFIPAVKKKSVAHMPQPDPVFVKETVTEMVPVEKMVPHVQEVIKAERVPQKIITDFVETNGNNVPSNVDDRLLPNERLITSVVDNFD